MKFYRQFNVKPDGYPFKGGYVLFGLFCMSLFCMVASAALPKEARVPGGIAMIDVPSAMNRMPTVWYQGQRTMVTQHKDRWVAIVGISLSATIGAHYIEVAEKVGSKVKIPFEVKKKAYKTQYITIKNKRKVNPNKMDMTRINKERTIMDAVLQTWTEHKAVSLSFIQPVAGRLSSPFGLRRFFNEQPRKPHGGLDIAAPKGTMIKAPAAGVVVNTGHYFFNGNAVFVDHGQGLITLYCHLDKISVATGQQVQAGDPLGTVGKTGRATGPHLHWGVSLNNTKVDPALFMP